ncbi:Ger(x)C family spore germination protein [Cohnella luojiensis]|uniref:Ger(X)C family spore germination protein n=1 Tax=Cohnella luojiensis TaxID=652876 RepID=A0A4Y8LYS1_9BACL|nr:Ger(x)C family spore germination protein [Cohnella luojiensis]TFE27478.1 Ger(x)C family spore germination protein [Cohnella luojiensis]
MMKGVSALLIVPFFLTSAGCVQKSVIDQITLPIVAGIDKGPGSMISVTISSPLYKGDGESKIMNIVSTAASRTSQKAGGILQEENQSPFHYGKLSVTLAGSELAKGGISKALDSTLRDPRVSKLMYLAVVDGRAQQMLEADWSKQMEKGRYLHQLITNNIKSGHLPPNNLHMFEYAWLGQGRDPYLPLVKLQEKKIKITGLALFDDDKFVASLNDEEMKIFRLLVEKTKTGTFEVGLNTDEYVSILNQHSQVRYRMATRSGIPEFTIRVRMKGMIREITAHKLKVTDPYKRRVELELGKSIIDTGEELIRRFQKLGIDPLGFGDFARSRTRHWDEVKWREQYPHLKVTIDAEVNISGTGATK